MLTFLLLLTVCSESEISNGSAKAATKPDPQRFRLEDGSDGTYVGFAF